MSIMVLPTLKLYGKTLLVSLQRNFGEIQVHPIFTLRLNHGTEAPFYGRSTNTEWEHFMAPTVLCSSRLF